MSEKIPKKILIVEDNSDLANLLSSQMSDAQTLVTLAYDGEEGLQKILSEKPDIVILDIMLPKMTGDSVLTELYKKNPSLKTPIIVLSNTDNTKLISHIMKWPTVTFLPKVEQDFDTIVRVVREKLALT